jgi:hypothetical protein
MCIFTLIHFGQLATVGDISTFPYIPLQTKFPLQTDHSILTWLISFKNIKRQTACWIGTYKDITLLPSTSEGGSTAMPMRFTQGHADKSVWGGGIDECVWWTPPPHR